MVIHFPEKHKKKSKPSLNTSLLFWTHELFIYRGISKLLQTWPNPSPEITKDLKGVTTYPWRDQCGFQFIHFEKFSCKFVCTKLLIVKAKSTVISIPSFLVMIDFANERNWNQDLNKTCNRSNPVADFGSLDPRSKPVLMLLLGSFLLLFASLTF